MEGLRIGLPHLGLEVEDDPLPPRGVRHLHAPFQRLAVLGGSMATHRWVLGVTAARRDRQQPHRSRGAAPRPHLVRAQRVASLDGVRHHAGGFSRLIRHTRTSYLKLFFTGRLLACSTWPRRTPPISPLWRRGVLVSAADQQYTWKGLALPWAGARRSATRTTRKGTGGRGRPHRGRASGTAWSEAPTTTTTPTPGVALERRRSVCRLIHFSEEL